MTQQKNEGSKDTALCQSAGDKLPFGDNGLVGDFGSDRQSESRSEVQAITSRKAFDRRSN